MFLERCLIPQGVLDGLQEICLEEFPENENLISL